MNTAELIEKSQNIGKKEATSQRRKTFVVSLKGLAPWISTVYYEKDEKDLKLYFTLQQGEISSENLSLQIQGQNDLIIIVGEKEAQRNTPVVAIPRLRDKETEDPTAKLLARILNQLEYSRNRDIYGCHISRKDFQECDANPRALGDIILSMKEHFGGQSSYLLTFETSAGSGTKALLWSQQKEIKDAVRSRKGAKERGSWMLLEGLEKSREIKDILFS